MSAKWEAVKKLAADGFFLFRLVPNSKIPTKESYEFYNYATRDLKTLEEWFKDKDDNVGISCDKFGDEGLALVVIDIDVKKGKDGLSAFEELKKEISFPKTRIQTTPSGGYHLIYKVASPVKGGVNVLGEGVDIRSHHQYVVGFGSNIDEKPYIMDDIEVAFAPEKLIEKCQKPVSEKKENVQKLTPEQLDKINQTVAMARAEEFLETQLTSTAGGRNHEAYITANKLKDFGLNEVDVFNLMLTAWKCEPMLETEELRAVVRSAFKYGQNPQGVAAPETHFEKIEGKKEEPLHPFDELNNEYAFVILGSSHCILHETTDYLGNKKTVFLSETAFHAKLAPKTMLYEGKSHAISKLWIKSPKRRSFNGIVFSPGNHVGSEWYNLWRGFAILPKPIKESEPGYESLQMFLEHAKKNICNGDDELLRWLIGYFAHLIQTPGKKPLTALVFKGAKGTGKNALIRIIGKLLGQHYLLVADSRYLTGNFNSHLENCLMICLDEAFWGGDKRAEGILKHLVTGEHHTIEKKGYEPYTVDNYTRVIIIGNEDWVVPASEDERRYAVFNVGEGRQQDVKFFTDMREGMEAGGYALLHQYLLDYDLSNFEINKAPFTEGLLEQKLEGLEPVFSWWFNCLKSKRIVGLEHDDGEWKDKVEKDKFRAAFFDFCNDRKIKSRLPDDFKIARKLRKCAKNLKGDLRLKKDGKSTSYYEFPSLEECRSGFESFLRHKITWE